MAGILKLSRHGWPLLVLVAWGCGGAGGPKLAPVSGKVTVGGSEPFKKGIIRFLPPPTSKLNSREAVTDEDGNYTIKFFANQNGLEPGDYMVAFSLFQMPDGSPVPDPPAERPKGAVQVVPQEYYFGSTNNPTTVPESGGTFDFDIPELKTP